MEAISSLKAQNKGFQCGCVCVCVSVCRRRFTSPAPTSSSPQTRWTTGPPSPPSLWSCLQGRRPTGGSDESPFKFPRAAAAALTHDALLRRRRHDVADVQVLGGQLAVQAQEVAESPLDGEVLALEEGEGGLVERSRGWKALVEALVNVPAEVLQNIGHVTSSFPHIAISKLTRWYLKIHLNDFTGCTSAAKNLKS